MGRPQLPASFIEALDAVATDQTAGASRLAALAAEALGHAAENAPAEAGEAYWDRVMARLALCRPMAPLLNLAAEAVRALEQGGAEAVGRSAVDFAHRLLSSQRDTAFHAAQRLRAGETLLTYSASAAVRDALVAASRTGRGLRVIVSEGRPAREGASLAEALAEAGLPVRLTPDAALAGFLREAGRFWIGADAVTPDGIVNKVGTATLAEVAERRGVPVEILASTAKFLPRSLAAHLVFEKGRVEEIHPGNVERLVVDYPAFDITPWESVSRVITEEGVLSPAEVVKRLEGIPSVTRLIRLLSKLHPSGEAA